jgi:hypothetical protein
MREEEDAIVYGRRRPKRTVSSKSASKGKTRTPGAVHAPQPPVATNLPEGCVDLLVEDKAAEAVLAHHDRHRGDPNHMGGLTKRVYRRVGGPAPPSRKESMTGATGEGYVEERRPSEAPAPAFGIGEDEDEEGVDEAKPIVRAASWVCRRADSCQRTGDGRRDTPDNGRDGTKGR